MPEIPLSVGSKLELLLRTFVFPYTPPYTHTFVRVQCISVALKYCCVRVFRNRLAGTHAHACTCTCYKRKCVHMHIYRSVLRHVFSTTYSPPSSPVGIQASVLPGTSWGCSFETRCPLPVPTNVSSCDYRTKVYTMFLGSV